MSTIEYKCPIGDLYKVKVKINIEDPEFEEEFIAWNKRTSPQFETHKEFKEFGKWTLHTRAESYERHKWMVYQAYRAINILASFIYHIKYHD